jgi:hypothetical protein
VNSDLLSLLVFVAFVVLSLLGRRKKAPPPSGPPRPRPATRPPPRLAGLQRSPPARPAPPRTGNALRDFLAQLEQAAEPEGVPRPAPEPEPTEVEVVSLERVEEPTETARWMAGIERSTESLETLEEAGTKSHARFRERYQTTAAALVTTDAAASAGQLAALRRAIIWSEILAPPVSLRE